jgi:hypothetical protein
MDSMIKYLSQKPTSHKSNSGVPRIKGVYASFYGSTRTKAIEFLKSKIKFVDDDGTTVERNFIDMMRDDEITGAERRAMVDRIWDGLVRSIDNDGEYSSIWDMPGMLFKLTKPGGDFSQFDNPKGVGMMANCKRDRLMIPEMTINAKLISSDTRNGLWKIGKTTKAIYNELGNPKTGWSRPKNAGYYRYMPPVSAILRVLGGEIFLRTKKCEPKMTGGVYQPHCRKKVFDVELMGFEDDNAIPVYSVVDYSIDKVSKKDWNSF